MDSIDVLDGVDALDGISQPIGSIGDVHGMSDGIHMEGTGLVGLEDEFRVTRARSKAETQDYYTSLLQSGALRTKQS